MSVPGEARPTLVKKTTGIAPPMTAPKMKVNMAYQVHSPLTELVSCGVHKVLKEEKVIADEPMKYDSTAVDNDITVTSRTPTMTNEKGLDSIDLETNVAYQFDTVSPSTTAITESDGARELGRSVTVPEEAGPTLVKKTKGGVPPMIARKPKMIVVNKACPPPTDREVKADDKVPSVKVKVKYTSNLTSPGK